LLLHPDTTNMKLVARCRELGLVRWTLRSFATQSRSIFRHSLPRLPRDTIPG
jgi:hypothetical protein